MTNEPVSGHFYTSEHHAVAQDEKDVLDTKSGPTFVARFKYGVMSILPKLALPVAILAGCAITAGTTYALVHWVQHLIATAAVSSDPTVWVQQARTEAYEPCYYGCNDCRDTLYAYNACAMTAKANVTGVICDGNQIWNWEDRYPDVCLQAVGVLYQAAALKKLKQSFRNRLAIIILTILAGIIGTIVTYFLWKKATASLNGKAKTLKEENERLLRENAPVWFARESSPSGLNDGKPNGTSKPRRMNQRFAFLGSLALLFQKTNAYPCTGYNPSVNQYFVNTNSTISGVVHGWLSDCYDYTCDCITTCSGGTAPSCSTICQTCTDVDATPSSFINKIMPKVEDCGFKMVDEVEVDVDVRVANALIEKNWWVKISVNTYNLTKTATDPSIICLHAIGG